LASISEERLHIHNLYVPFMPLSQIFPFPIPEVPPIFHFTSTSTLTSSTSFFPLAFPIFAKKTMSGRRGWPQTSNKIWFKIFPRAFRRNNAEKRRRERRRRNREMAREWLENGKIVVAVEGLSKERGGDQYNGVWE
jgi:hypothetical protein